jgi:hypothetical protein
MSVERMNFVVKHIWLKTTTRGTLGDNSGESVLIASILQHYLAQQYGYKIVARKKRSSTAPYTRRNKEEAEDGDFEDEDFDSTDEGDVDDKKIASGL